MRRLQDQLTIQSDNFDFSMFLIQLPTVHFYKRRDSLLQSVSTIPTIIKSLRSRLKFIIESAKQLVQVRDGNVEAVGLLQRQRKR